MGYFNEKNEAVIRAIKHLIKKAHENNITISICGQAPSIYPDFCEILVNEGIDSISVNADVASEIADYIAEIESELVKGTDKEPRQYSPQSSQSKQEPYSNLNNNNNNSNNQEEKTIENKNSKPQEQNKEDKDEILDIF